MTTTTPTTTTIFRFCPPQPQPLPQFLEIEHHNHNHNTIFGKKRPQIVVYHNCATILRSSLVLIRRSRQSRALSVGKLDTGNENVQQIALGEAPNQLVGAKPRQVSPPRKEKSLKIKDFIVPYIKMRLEKAVRVGHA